MMFPSPYGAWVLSMVPDVDEDEMPFVSVPLRGMGFIIYAVLHGRLVMFPSPYGAWVLSAG